MIQYINKYKKTMQKVPFRLGQNLTILSIF